MIELASNDETLLEVKLLTLIYLVRHAQAVHDGSQDFQRQLTPSGIAQSQNIGDWLRDKSIVPDVVIVSASVRTCQTLVHMAIDAREIISDAAYNASQDELLEILRNAQTDASAVMLIAHNPGISLLAMTCGFENELRTSELVVIEFNGDIRDFIPEQAKVVHHYHPNV